MTSESRLVHAASKALRGSSEPAAPRADQRERVVAWLEEALEAKARRRRTLRRVALTALATTAAAASLFVGWKIGSSGTANERTATTLAEAAANVESLSGTAFVETSPGGRTPLGPRQRIENARNIDVEEGALTLALVSGTRLDVAAATRLRVERDATSESVALEHGTVTAHVAKVAPGARFVVHAGDVDVEVRGTVFRVERGATGACGPYTNVTVQEGRVAVRSAGSETVLAAGDRWTSPCAKATPAHDSASAPAPVAPTVEEQRPRVPPSAAHPVPVPAPGKPIAASELAAQNALFAEAMATKSRGDTVRAIEQLDAFLTRYPTSPLHEAASAQRMRLLSSVDRARAATAARDYIRRYPRGFARTDADRILETNP